MDLQKINIKVFVDAPEQVPLDPFLDIFAEWREDTSHPAAWIDLADYAHIAGGPGVMLIGHQGNLATDLGDPGPGLLYANKQGLTGDLEERIREAFRRALAHIARLTTDTRYPSGLRPRPGFMQVVFNDRLDVPNTDATHQVLESPVRAVATELLGSGPYTLIREPDPARRYGMTIHSDTADSLDQMAAGLQTPTS